MKEASKRSLIWTPRILCMLFAVFISLFALDVFGEGRGFWGTLLALSMHLIPTAIILVTLALSWRWPWIGGIVCIAMAAFYVAWAWGRFPFATYLVISGPLALVGILFLISWYYRNELRSAS